MQKKDIGLGAVSIVFGIWIWWMVANLKSGAAFWPKIVAGTIILLGAIIMVMGVLTYSNAKKQNSGKMTIATGKAKPRYLQVLTVTAVLIIYYFAFQYIGYTIPTFLMICATSIILGYRNWKAMVIIALLISTGLYAAFSNLFGIRFPGIFF